MSFRKEKFRCGLEVAHKAQKYKWPKGCKFEILLWISYMGTTKKQKLPKYSNWKRLHELWKSSILIGWAQYVSDLSNKNGLCLSKIEAGKKLLVYPYLLMFVECLHEDFLAKFWIFDNLWAILNALQFEFRTLY